jgi:peptide-methionine (S)-S-oxide reductase
MPDTPTEIATFAAGCFWCTEAIFKRLKGVTAVASGYAGGAMENPSYENVSTGSTGHAEAIQITFTPTVISYAKLLEVFFATHDPTTKNQQGADIGTQYRSVIFYHSEDQKDKAEQMIRQLEKEHTYKQPIVTEVVPYSDFFSAEEYHQDFYEKNQLYPYCTVVINPKLKKLMEEFRSDVKEEYKMTP